MYYKQSFPLISYGDFVVSDNTIRIAVEGFVKKNINFFFEYTVQDFERPETVAFDFYGNSRLSWILILVNDVQDPFHDWVMDQSVFRKFLIKKYLGDEIDADEWHHFENEQGTTIPDPGTDSLRAKYGISNLDFELNKVKFYRKDGVRIVEPSSEVQRDLYKVSFLDYEEQKNQNNREIKIPRPEYMTIIESELETLLNV